MAALAVVAAALAAESQREERAGEVASVAAVAVAAGWVMAAAEAERLGAEEATAAAPAHLPPAGSSGLHNCRTLRAEAGRSSN